MSNYQQLLDDYQGYAQASPGLFGDKWQPCALKPVRVERTRQELDCAGLLAELKSLGAVDGWLLLTDQKLVLQQQTVESLDRLLLAGELYQSGRSLRVRQLSAGQWLLVTTCIEAAEAAQATHVAIAVTQLASAEGVGSLEYAQLWCRNEQGRLHIEDAVFNGFQGA